MHAIMSNLKVESEIGRSMVWLFKTKEDCRDLLI